MMCYYFKRTLPGPKGQSDSFSEQSLIQPKPGIVIYRFKGEINIAKRQAARPCLCVCVSKIVSRRCC